MRKQISLTMGMVFPATRGTNVAQLSTFPLEINANHKHHKVSSYDQLLSKGKR